MELTKKIMTRFDLWCERIGKTSAYKKSFWWYTTQYNYVGLGMGKFYNIRQVIGFFVYGEVVMQGIEKIITLPHNFRKWFWISAMPVTLCFWVLGRFFDYSDTISLESEWSNIRNPAMIELRNKNGNKKFNKKEYIRRVLNDE